MNIHFGAEAAIFWIIAGASFQSGCRSFLFFNFLLIKYERSNPGNRLSAQLIVTVSNRFGCEQQNFSYFNFVEKLMTEQPFCQFEEATFGSTFEIAIGS